MNRNPQLGDIIQIPGLNGDHVIIELEQINDAWAPKGKDPFYDLTFDVIPHRVGEIGIAQKAKKFRVLPGNLNFPKRTGVRATDLKLIGAASVSKKIVVEYKIADVK